ncbi:MAG: hypothetical protein JW839_15260 [Candidatus Lokiarchaeota archaeon]|nr:hypothetical protein [Candidatus Lokiarchaeota archaeon]
MNDNNPTALLLGHFTEIARYCELCSIGMEDAVRIARELDRIRSASQANAKAIDIWWREFCGTLASLHDHYLALMQPTPDNESTRNQARDLVKDGTRPGRALSEPLNPFLDPLKPDEIQAVSEIASDLFDSIILKLFSLLENT